SNQAEMSGEACGATHGTHATLATLGIHGIRHTPTRSLPLRLQNRFHRTPMWTWHRQVAERNNALPLVAFWKWLWNWTGENAQTNEIFRNRMAHLEQGRPISWNFGGRRQGPKAVPTSAR